MRMPTLFVGHGNPLNALEANAFSLTWAELGQSLPRPASILCVSAHWDTDGSFVTAMDTPETIHDFHGFPRKLYEMNYAAPGSPELARRVQELVRTTRISPNQSWGLDHGAWSVLCRMYPEADIPVVQISLDGGAPAEFHYALGRELRPLREEGVLILGSGNIVHNLRTMVWNESAFDWAAECDAALATLIASGDHQALINFERIPHARQAIPTEEHYLPLLYVLGAMHDEEEAAFFNAQVTLGSISMRGVRAG